VKNVSIIRQFKLNGCPGTSFDCAVAGGTHVRTFGFTAVFGPLLFAAAGILLVAAGASAQAYWQPQPAPVVTAENESWFRLGEPITFEGYVYYPAGARVFFDGNVMVRSGAFRGIPIYTDTTIEAYSRVFVPVTGGQLQPYERRRTGDAAGTTGSRAPSFPVTMAGETLKAPPAISTFGVQPEPAPPTEPVSAKASAANDVARLSIAPGDVVEAGLRPKGLNEVYVTYAGARWRSAGKAVRLNEARFERIGQAGTFPVYAERGGAQNPAVIYVPSRSGFVAPYARAGNVPRY
jgi:hypothetical protein